MLDAPLKAGHDSGEHNFAFPRHEMPESCMVRVPQEQEGRECRMLAAPMARLQQGKQAAITTDTPKQSGIPCATVLRLIAFSPWSAGLDSLRRPGIITQSFGASGPHAFAVRGCFTRPTKPTASIASRTAFVTIAKRPSNGCGTGERYA